MTYFYPLLLTFDNSPRLITCRHPRGGPCERTDGPFARHAGPVGPENTGAGADARLGHRAAYPADIKGSIAGRTGIALSSVAAAGEPRMACGRLKDFRD